MRRRRLLGSCAAVALGVSALVTLVPVPPAGAYAVTPVNAKRIIGYSVEHRPIVAYRLGDAQAKITAVLIGQMHGDEHAGVQVARSLVFGRRAVEGIRLWVIPTMNPDGNARGTRQNAHHVDLNRNWPDYWAPLTGEFYSGPKPRSEPETRAVLRFLLGVRPRYVVVLHQPLYGVDTTDGGRLDHSFRNRLAANLGLPLKPFRCGGFCHGSLTGWYTTHRFGIADTVEFGRSLTTRYLTGQARRGIVDALGGHFGGLWAHNPRRHLHVGTAVGQARLSGWAFDVDAPDRQVQYTAELDGSALRTARTRTPRPVVNSTYDLTGEHGFDFMVTVRPGRHTFCMTFGNIGAGTANPRNCITVTVPAPPSPTPSPTTSPTP
jgi:hypothetical protein